MALAGEWGTILARRGELGPSDAGEATCESEQGVVMCGFVGGVFARRINDRDVAVMRAAVEELEHRGPDGAGLSIVDRGNAILAFRRLAIIDLDGGEQPMCTEDGQFIVFNGEIYNFRQLRHRLQQAGLRFRTKSDTEVLLRWLARSGGDDLSGIEGMFAFAFLDPGRNRLVLARDRLGIKQIYYTSCADGFFFASEPKALVKLPWIRRALAQDQLPAYFTFRCVPAPRTLFEGIAKLQPGEQLEYDLSTRTSKCHLYWQFPRGGATPEFEESSEGALDRFEAVFQDAIAKRLVADVPVGAFLSGGLDSSLVVAGIHRAGWRGFKTFSATFPGSPDDEATFAARVSRRFDVENFQYAIRHNDFLGVLAEWVYLNDDLVADASSLPLLHVSRLARREGCIVLLSGEGADELFGGYGSYHKFLLLNRLAKLVPGTGTREGLVRLLRAVRALNAQDVPRVEEYFVGRRQYMGTAALLGEEGLRELLDPRLHAQLMQVPRAEAASFASIGAFDFARRIPDDLLVRTDRATMGASIEARVPFLDHHLVEFTATLPQSQRSLFGVSKVLLRRLALRWGVPRQTILHRKIGFQVPIGEWFRGPLRPVWERVVRRSAVPGIAYGSVRRLLDDHLRGRGHFEEILWRILALEAWYAKWVLDEPLFDEFASDGVMVAD